MFNCAFCNYSTKRKYDLNRHHNAKHIDKNTKCENEENVNQNDEKLLQKTEKLLQNKEKLLQKTEKLLHSNDITPFQCKKCNKKYKTQTLFINKKSFNNIKNEIKNIIKTNVLF